MLKRLAVHFNDGLAVLLIVGVLTFWAALPRLGLPEEQGSLIVGAGIVWIGQVVTYYFRKRPDEPSQPSVPPRG